MIRRETYCDGRLVKEIAQVDVGGAATGFRAHYVDGVHRWLLDGNEVTETDAQELQASWSRTAPGTPT